MLGEGVLRNTITYCAASSACEKGKKMMMFFARNKVLIAHSKVLFASNSFEAHSKVLFARSKVLHDELSHTDEIPRS